MSLYRSKEVSRHCKCGHLVPAHYMTAEVIVLVALWRWCCYRGLTSTAVFFCLASLIGFILMLLFTEVLLGITYNRWNWHTPHVCLHLRAPQVSHAYAPLLMLCCLVSLDYNAGRSDYQIAQQRLYCVPIYSRQIKEGTMCRPEKSPGNFEAYLQEIQAKFLPRSQA